MLSELDAAGSIGLEDSSLTAGTGMSAEGAETTGTEPGLGRVGVLVARAEVTTPLAAVLLGVELCCTGSAGIVVETSAGVPMLPSGGKPDEVCACAMRKGVIIKNAAAYGKSFILCGDMLIHIRVHEFNGTDKNP